MNWMIPAVVGLYLVGSVAYGLFQSRREPAGSDDFLSGGRNLGPIVVGFALASQFFGPGQILGVAEEAFKRGGSAGWAVINLGLGFLVLSLGVAARYRREGHFTTSGALASVYGPAVRPATALVMGLALSGVSVVVYVAGASVIAMLLGVPYAWAVAACGLVVSLGVASGGMRFLVRANTVHSIAALTGCGLGLWYGLRAAGGLTGIEAATTPGFTGFFALPPELFLAWFLANLGAVGSSQSVVQLLGSAASPRVAQGGTIVASILLTTGGILAALAGTASRALFPEISPTLAFPALTGLMPPPVAGLVVAGLIGGLLATASSSTLSVSTLFIKDFYVPFLRPGADQGAVLRASRWAALVVGLLPIPLALLTPPLFPVIFLARALRTTLFAVVVAGFYLPALAKGNANAAILAGMGATLAWYFTGNPMGLDSVYISLLTPLLMLLLLRQPDETPNITTRS